MTASTSSNLAATLIATAVGIGTWLSGLGSVVWLAHPQVAALAVTIVVSIVVKQVWPRPSGQKSA